MSFWGELKRRNVVKVGAAYLVVAWLLAQIVSLVVPTFNAPAWVSQTVIFLLILGLPIILIVAWAFEITPEGIKTTSNVPISESITPVTGQKLNYAVVGLLGLAVAFMFVDNYVLNDVQESTAASSATVEGCRFGQTGLGAGFGGRTFHSLSWVRIVPTFLHPES